MKCFVFVGLLVSVVSAAASGQTNSGASATAPEVTAVGAAEVRIPPTYAVVGLAVTTRANTAADAASQTAAKVAATVNALRQAGIAADDITTQGYSLDPAYDEKNRTRGFTARNSLQVRVNRIDQVGTIIDAAVGGGTTDISSIQYGSPGIEEARRSAMAEAVKKARADAAAVATAAGGTLGRLISISSGSNAPMIYGNARLESVVVTAGMSSPTVISPKDLSAVATASGRWEFVPAR